MKTIRRASGHRRHVNGAVGTPRPAFAALVTRLNVKTLKLEINMKTYIPTLALVATLTFACANSFAQKPSPVPDIPKTPVAPRALSLPAQAREEIEAAAATEAALAAQETALEA